MTERKLARWSKEEMRLLARLEAQAVAEGNSRNINKFLVQMHPNRTLESIKGRRRHPDHKGLVLEYLEAIRGSWDMPSTEPALDASRLTAEILPGPLSDEMIQDGAASDRAENDSLSVEMLSAQKAVDLLSTVSGHGVQTLLEAAQGLVEQGRDPTDAIGNIRLLPKAKAPRFAPKVLRLDVGRGTG